MKRQVRFEETGDKYLFSDDDRGSVFTIMKDTLIFSSNDFYQAFFKDLEEKPDYQLINPTAKLTGQAKHVFDTVEAIFKKSCGSIDDRWFTNESDAKRNRVETR